MTAYRSAGIVLALAVLCACASAPPHPSGWTQVSTGVWTTMSGAGTERFHYTSTPTQGSMTDLASRELVDTVQSYPGSKLLHSVPFPACPGEAGLATYSLPGRRTLEIAFTVDENNAIVVQYERPSSVGEAPAAAAAMRQAVCYAL